MVKIVWVVYGLDEWEFRFFVFVWDVYGNVNEDILGILKKNFK